MGDRANRQQDRAWRVSSARLWAAVGLGGLCLRLLILAPPLVLFGLAVTAAGGWCYWLEQHEDAAGATQSVGMRESARGSRGEGTARLFVIVLVREDGRPDGEKIDADGGDAAAGRGDVRHTDRLCARV